MSCLWPDAGWGSVPGGVEEGGRTLSLHQQSIAHAELLTA